MKPFGINFATIVIRFYLMMAAVVLGVFTGQYWITILALPIFLSAMLGISFSKSTEEKTHTVAGNKQKQMQQAA